jgi:DNA-binding IclR family transcriptional regulator
MTERKATPASRSATPGRQPRPGAGTKALAGGRGTDGAAAGAADAAAGERSLIRTLRIVERLAHAPSGLSLAALSSELELPKSSLLGLLRSLCGHGYAQHAEGGYVLGPSAFRLAAAIMPTMSLSRAAAPVMRRLVERSGETALIALLDRDEAKAVYVEKVESARSIRYSVPIGATRPLHCSAAGRVLLAHADAEFIEAFLRRAPFPRLTPQTLTSGAELRALLPRIREQGVAITVGEVSADVAGFAAPVFDHRGQVVAALAMAAPASRTGSDPAEQAQLLRDAAREISLNLGHQAAPAVAVARSAEDATPVTPQQRPKRTKPT